MTSRQKTLGRWASGLLAATLVLLPASGYADELTEVQQQQEEKKNEVDNLQQEKEEKQEAVNAKSGELDALSAEQSKLLDQLEAVDMQIVGVQDALQQLKNQITEIEANVAKTQEEIDALQIRVDKNTKKFKERLNVMYKNGTVAPVEVLLSSKGINDFLSRARTMKTLADYDRNLIDELIRDVKELEIKTNELKGQKASLELAKGNEQTKLNELEVQQAEKQSLVAQVGAQIDLTNEELTNLASASSDLQGRIDARKAEISELAEREESIRQQRLQAQQQAQQQEEEEEVPAPSGSSEFLWPATSYTITSYFGSRTHPIYGVTRYHSGLDIAAGYGTSVYASKGGTVVDASYCGGYGYLVEIDHGDGTMTRYAHLSSFNCSIGQSVSQGQVVAYVGSTGASTGPHLHFEILVNGVQVDPLGYL